MNVDDAGTTVLKIRPAESLLRFSVAAAIGLSCAFVSCLALWEQKLHTIDGAFQTYAAVSEYGIGHALGRDFQSYLGALMPLVLVPFYWLGGSTFAASAVGARLAVFVALVFWLWFLCRLAGVPRQLVWRLIIPLLALTVAFRPDMWNPGASLRPLRWVLAPAAAALALPLFRRIVESGKRPPLHPAALVGLLGAIAIMWSNDVGIPTAIALLFALFLLLINRADVGRLVQTITIFCGSLVLGVLALATLLTQNHLADWAKYTFIEIPSTQGWMFAPWGDGSRLLEVGDVQWLFRPVRPNTVTLLITAVAAGWAVIRIVCRKGAPAVTAAMIVAYLGTVGGALLPQVAGHFSSGYQVATVLTALFAPATTFRSRWLPIARRLSHAVFSILPLARLQRWGFVTLVNGVAWISIPTLLGLEALKLWEVAPFRTDHQFEPRLGLWVPSESRRAIGLFAQLGQQFDASGTPADRRIMSTYFSPFTIVAHAHPTTSYPSIIHALGDHARGEFIAAIRQHRAPIFTTIRPTYSGWETWNLRAHWPIYRALLENYEPFARTSQHILWRAVAPHAPLNIALRCTVALNQTGVIDITVAEIMPRSGGGVFSQVDVAMEMQGDRPLRWFWRAEAPKASEFATRADPISGAYDDSPYYGLPPKDRLEMVAVTTAEQPYKVRLEAIPKRLGDTIKSATCTATSVAAKPDLEALPLLKSMEQLTVSTTPIASRGLRPVR